MRPGFPPEDLAVRLCKGYTDGPNGCMVWTKATSKKGYGWIKIGSKADRTNRNMHVHRLAASIWLGLDLNSPLQALHKCDNPPCINPDHLFLGTNQDNVDDCIAKGRFTGRPKGTTQPDRLVREVMQCIVMGVAIARLAKIHGVKSETIRRIVLHENRELADRKVTKGC